MVDRRDVGSWLEGPPSRRSSSSGDAPAYPGSRLGLPQAGPRSVGRPGRRLVAVVVDWALCLLVSSAFVDGDPWATLGIFAGVQVLTVGSLGSSPGHALLGLRLQRVAGGWPGPVAAVVRTLLLCLVIPALVFDTDQRGVHDRAAGTVLLRR